MQTILVFYNKINNSGQPVLTTIVYEFLLRYCLIKQILLNFSRPSSVEQYIAQMLLLSTVLYFIRRSFAKARQPQGLVALLFQVLTFSAIFSHLQDSCFYTSGARGQRLKQTRKATLVCNVTLCDSGRFQSEVKLTVQVFQKPILKDQSTKEIKKTRLIVEKPSLEAKLNYVRFKYCVGNLSIPSLRHR